MQQKPLRAVIGQNYRLQDIQLFAFARRQALLKLSGTTEGASHCAA
ncbi:MAG: hypothetical protein U0Q55_23670 [Vicinamibacterales bacterium]